MAKPSRRRRGPLWGSMLTVRLKCPCRHDGHNLADVTYPQRPKGVMDHAAFEADGLTVTARGDAVHRVYRPPERSGWWYRTDTLECPRCRRVYQFRHKRIAAAWAEDPAERPFARVRVLILGRDL